MKSYFFPFITVFYVLLGCNNHKSNGIENSEATIKVEDDSSTLILKAHLLYSNNKYQEALEYYTKLLEIDSTHGKFYYRKAYCLVQLYRHSESIKFYQKASDLNYSKFDCYKSIGLTYTFALKNDSLACVYFRMCLQLEPGNEEIIELMKAVDKSAKLNNL
ncbi:MAG: tetratricopeptide repeat protein [Cyclobacteriaceae bacterium]|nr:tetratricopeptide repeat protein [Cyclobacteriaceae bacterium]